tara:strand:- start:4762 stop:4944 length:183 start_codon:yes stop_codon:yes gene_type:complete
MKFKEKKIKGSCFPGILFLLVLVIGISCLDTDLAWLGSICMLICVFSLGFVVQAYFNPNE